MKFFSYAISAFSLLVLSGGVYGFLKASSVPSLVMSLVFFILLLIGSVQVYKGNIKALYLSAITVFALHLFFLMRFLKTLKLMPAGVMVLLTASLGIPLFYYLTKKVKSKAYDQL